MSETGRGRPFTQYTAWTPALLTPMRTFLRTETGGAAVLLAAAVASLVWVNAAPSSYDSVWHTDLSIHVGDAGIGQDLRGWVNSGLMTLFFFVVGLEARREFDVGELRERRRVTLPLLAGVAGMAAPVLIYLAINAGHGSSGGWGAAMSTDTAFALGIDWNAYGMQLTELVSTGYGSSDSNCASGTPRPSATPKLALMRRQNCGSLTLRNDDTFANSVLNKL